MIPQRLTVVRGLLLLVCALLGVTVLARHSVPLDLLVLPVAAVALRAGSLPGALMGMTAGLLVDLFPPGTGVLGLSAFSYAAAGALLGFLHRSLRVSVLLPLLAVLAAELVVQLVRCALVVSTGIPVDLLTALWFVLLTGAVGALVVPVLIRMERGFVRRGMA